MTQKPGNGEDGSTPREADIGAPVVYWHHELPPLDAEVVGEHTLETTSGRVPGTLAHRDELWQDCYDDLMERTRARLEQEVARLGGRFAHVLTESIDSKRDDVANEAWLYGRFTYVLYSSHNSVRCLCHEFQGHFPITRRNGVALELSRG